MCRGLVVVFFAFTAAAATAAAGVDVPALLAATQQLGRLLRWRLVLDLGSLVAAAAVPLLLLLVGLLVRRVVVGATLSRRQQRALLLLLLPLAHVAHPARIAQPVMKPNEG